ncbi:partial Sulfur carrier protein ThiS adenylyltransferase, partial [Anaerolineae bacterium]
MSSNESAESPLREQRDLIDVSVDTLVLSRLSEQCAQFLRERRAEVETGGLILGHFDGDCGSIKHLILDEHAESTSTSIRLSASVYAEANRVLREMNRGARVLYLLLGTWHGHPGTSNTPSETDRRTLFQESMRLRTDDPGSAQVPPVHLIFQDYGREPNRVKAFTMQLDCSFDLRGRQSSSAERDLLRQWSEAIAAGVWIGVLWATDGGNTLELKPYHPDTFSSRVSAQGVLSGFWKYYPYPRTRHEFEKTFLENFYQKTLQDTFVYVRLFPSVGSEPLTYEWFETKRRSGPNLALDLVRFVEIKLAPEVEVVCQNPDVNQSFTLTLPVAATVKQIAKAIARECGLQSPPSLSSSFRDAEASEIARKALVRGTEVVLPDDLTLAEIQQSVRYPGMPIYFRTLDLDSKRRFDIRTLRFRQKGYDVDGLNTKHVLIGGVGLLGSEIAFNLALLGVGKITVVDNGSVDWYNIYRQIIFTRNDVYRRKVDVIKERLEDMGGVQVNPIFQEVPCWGSIHNYLDLISDLEMLDSVITRADL